MGAKKAAETKTTGDSNKNFGNAETIPEGGRYIANFDGDEINGKRYALGEEIAADVDAGTIRYLVQNGRVTEAGATDSATTATGGKGTTTPPASGGTKDQAAATAAVQLTDEEVVERDKLVTEAGGDADKLREAATGEGIDGDAIAISNDANEIATAIVVHRRKA